MKKRIFLPVLITTILLVAVHGAYGQLGGGFQPPAQTIDIVLVIPDTTDEVVTVQNNTFGPLDLTGWMLRVSRPNSRVYQRYFFPDECALPPKGMVTIHAGPATMGRADQACGAQAIDLVWQSAFVLPNEAGVVELLDAEGNLVTQYDYPEPVLPPVFVNEMEANPATGAEWVEIYNASNEPIDVTGWTVQTLVGTSVKLSLPMKGIIAARGFIVVGVPIEFLSDVGEILELRDARGNLVDATPQAGLPDTLADERCWARLGDGQPAWSFQTCTKNASNG